MGIVTRVDADIQHYFQVILEQDHVEEGDIQRLLDAYREKFEVDFVYVGEVLVDRKGLFFTHVSASCPRYNLLGRSHAFREDWESAAAYDAEGLSEESLDGSAAAPDKSLLHYAIVRLGEYDGSIGMIDFHRRRQWTAEERTAVQKLGRVLRHVLYVERGRKVSAAEQLRLSRQSDALEAVFASADCGIMRHSAEGELISINRAALDILGYENEEELEGDFDLIAGSVLDEDKPRLRSDIRGLQAVGDSAGMSYRVLHKDGAVLNVVGSVKLLEEDGVRFYQRFLIDCTAQRAREERELRREKRRQEEMIRALSVDFGSVYFVDLDTGMAVPYRMNEDIKQRFGDIFVGEISLKDSVELYIDAVVYEPDKELLRQGASVETLTAELAERASCYTTYRTCRNGVIEYFQMKAARAGAWAETHRAVLGFRSVDEEIRHEMSQKKLVEDAYEIIAGLSSDYNFIGLMNTDTGALSVHLADETLPEVAGALLGRERYCDAMDAYAAYVHEEDREAWREGTAVETVLTKLRDRKIYNVTVRNNAREKVEYIQFSFTRVAGEAGGSQVVLAKRVVTDTIERELQQRSQLETALAQAERANIAKSTFLSNMSHDIRTPMNAIIGFTTLALKHIDQRERVREYLGKIMSSGNHLLGLINDVLDMSRIESGKIHIEEHPCSLPEIWRELRNILHSEITAKGLALCIDAVDVRHEDIYCDKLRLDQVFLNLLSNAVKFTGTGGQITVRIVEKPCEREGFASYVFTVKDTGIGMSEDFLSRIFEPFERERTSTISGIQGTGLGMAIAKNIVDLMGGTISVKSRPGQGTEFTVGLSFRLQEEGREPVVIGELQGCHALVVDDDFNICDSVTGMLGEIGMRPEWTLSGREAVLRTRQALDRKDEYQVYLIDWLMPDMNGVEVARRIRREAGDHAPIIILSAYDWSDIEEEAREAGVTAFCGKPLFLSELRACLRSIVSPRQEEGPVLPAEPVRISAGDRILLAEDNALNREIAIELLGEAGFAVETAENGREAVEKLSASSPGYYRLVLMDVQMPLMDGYEATRTIRRLEDRELANIPILAMTANAFEEDRQAALASGMNGHIAKPIDVDKLLETLKGVLEG